MSTESKEREALPISERAKKLAEAYAGPWRIGREYLPFHPSASHIPPDYRDGWNAGWWMHYAENFEHALNQERQPPADVELLSVHQAIEKWLGVAVHKPLTQEVLTSLRAALAPQPPAAEEAQAQHVRRIGDLLDDLEYETSYRGHNGYCHFREPSEVRAEIDGIVARLATPPAQPSEPVRQPIPELPNGAWQQVPCAVCFEEGHPQRGWLFIPHADGKWVSLCKLPQFSEQIIRYWLAEPNAGG